MQRQHTIGNRITTGKMLFFLFFAMHAAIAAVLYNTYKDNPLRMIPSALLILGGSFFFGISLLILRDDCQDQNRREMRRERRGESGFFSETAGDIVGAGLSAINMSCCMIFFLPAFVLYLVAAAFVLNEAVTPAYTPTL